jgi:putative membrane protein
MARYGKKASKQMQWFAAAFGVAAIAMTVQQAAVAQASASQGTAAKSPSVASADVDFMRTVASGGATEVELGKLAGSKGSAAAQTKSFGSKMVEDHTRAGGELQRLAAAKSVALPDGPDAKQREQIDKIGKFDGNAFDAAFKKQMVDDHRSTVAAFEKAARSARDADLKAWVQKTLPVLLDHLKMAQALPG